MSDFVRTYCEAWSVCVEIHTQPIGDPNTALPESAGYKRPPTFSASDEMAVWICMCTSLGDTLELHADPCNGSPEAGVE